MTDYHNQHSLTYAVDVRIVSYKINIKQRLMHKYTNLYKTTESTNNANANEIFQASVKKFGCSIFL